MEKYEVFSVNHIDLCVSYNNGLSYKDPKKMFRMRQEFAKKYSQIFFGKNYDEMNLEEKFNLTYLTTNTNIHCSFKDFIMESGFRNLYKNKKNDIETYNLLEPIKNMFIINKNNLNESNDFVMNKKQFQITSNILNQKLYLNKIYRIYNMSIKKSIDIIDEKIITNFRKMLVNPLNEKIITKLNNKLYVHGESVFACIMMNVHKDFYNNSNDNWLKLKRKIRELKITNYEDSNIMKNEVKKGFQKYFLRQTELEKGKLRNGIYNNYINKGLVERINIYNECFYNEYKKIKNKEYSKEEMESASERLKKSFIKDPLKKTKYYTQSDI